MPDHKVSASKSTDSVFTRPYNKGDIGQTIYIKLVSFNIWQGGLQDISSVPVYTHVIGGPPTIYAPSGLTAIQGLSTVDPAIMVFGLLHGYLLWTGDILFTYGFCGLFAYLGRKWKPKKQITIGMIMMERKNDWAWKSASSSTAKAVPSVSPQTIEVAA